jgi:hypothetical protein
MQTVYTEWLSNTVKTTQTRITKEFNSMLGWWADLHGGNNVPVILNNMCGLDPSPPAPSPIPTTVNYQELNDLAKIVGNDGFEWISPLSNDQTV